MLILAISATLIQYLTDVLGRERWGKQGSCLMDSPVAPKQEEQCRAGDDQGQQRILSSLGSDGEKAGQTQQGARSGKTYLQDRTPQARSQSVVLILRSQWVKALGVLSHGSSPSSVV